MAKKIIGIVACVIGSVLSLSAQIGGTQTYSFLSLPNSARIAGMGGKVVSIIDNDLNLTYYNPALLRQEMGNHLTMNYTNYFTDINYGYASYALPSHRESKGYWAAGLYFIHYGTFTEADEVGTKLGEFTASEYTFTILYARPLSKQLNVGINIKPVMSYFERYASYGIAADLGISYANASKKVTSGLVLRNLGMQLTSYNEEVFNREKIPFEILAGITLKPQHAPFRLSFTFHQLQKPTLTYDSDLSNDTENNLDKGEEDELPAEFIYQPRGSSIAMFSEMFYTVQGFTKQYADPFFRHLNVTVEILPFPNFSLFLGYNHQRRKELSLASKPGLVGFSFGMGINIRKINISYGRANYHLAGGTNNFSIRTNLSNFQKTTAP